MDCDPGVFANLRKERPTDEELAAGVGLTYELLTGDLSQVNYSSIRAGLIEFRRRMEALQWQVLAHV
jgi:capsid protein